MEFPGKNNLKKKTKFDKTPNKQLSTLLFIFLMLEI